MRILDCKLNYGTQIVPKEYLGCQNIDELLAAMQNAGLSGGLIHCSDCDVVGVDAGNRRVSNDVKKLRALGMDAWAVWALVPSCTGETPSPENLPALMLENNVRALYVNPADHMFLTRPSVMGDYYAMAQDRKIPFLFDTAFGISLDAIDDILMAFPALTAIISYDGQWPRGRQLYPFLKSYPNTYLETGNRWDDRGVEDLMVKFGPGRQVFGSHYPEHYIGGPIAHVYCAQIPQEEKCSIFADTLARLIEEENLL